MKTIEKILSRKQYECQPFHDVWIKYFTMPTQNSTGIDKFLTRIPYTPKTLAAVKHTLGSCKDSADISSRLSSLFGFSEFPLEDCCELAQTFLIQNSACKLEDNLIGSFSSIMMRTLIVLSYVLLWL